MNCSAIDELLLDGSPAAMEQAQIHAAGCQSCAETLADWIEISATAGTMRAAWESEILWPRIRREIEGTRPRAGRRILQYAAAAMLAVLLGGTLLYTLRLQTRDADFDRDILRLAAVDEVERAEKAHVEAIAKLEKLAEPRLERPATPLAAAYKEKLMLLDDAIAECESNVENNEQNAHLRGQLLSMYSEKRQTLQDVLREGNHASN